MFDLIVLGLVVAGLAAIVRVPVPKSHQTEASTPPLPPLWAAQTDWSRFHKPTYLRRGIVLDSNQAQSTPPDKRPSPSGQAAQPAVREEAP
jgi:hypothetical protein